MLCIIPGPFMGVFDWKTIKIAWKSIKPQSCEIEKVVSKLQD